jgi:hypothetical protein
VPRPVRIRAVIPLEAFMVYPEFTDNTTTKDTDLKVYPHSPVFESLCKDSRYRAVPRWR